MYSDFLKLVLGGNVSSVTSSFLLAVANKFNENLDLWFI